MTCLYALCLKFTAGSDYENVNAELTFSAGPTLTQCVNITIIQDGAVENLVEEFMVQVNSSSSIAGLPDSATIFIQDMDRKSQHAALANLLIMLSTRSLLSIRNHNWV